MKYDGTRISGNQVETSINTFINPATDSTVGFVSLAHVGTPAYYETVEALLTAHEEAGAIIDFEFVAQPTEADRQCEPEMVDLCDRLYAVRNALSNIFKETFSLVGQREALPFHEGNENWQISDPPALETVKAIGAPAMEELIANHQEIVRHYATTDREQLRSDILTQHDPSFHLHSRMHPSPYQQALILERENRRIASLDTILSGNPNQNVTFAMGAGHLHGIGRNLERRGYRLLADNRLWIPAFSAD